MDRGGVLSAHRFGQGQEVRAARPSRSSPLISRRNHMHLGAVAERAPDRAAVIMGQSGETITFRELDERSNQLAQLFRSCGIERGGSVAIMLENHPRFLEAVWAAQRSGLYYTAINSHLTAEEVAYIVDDCGAELVVSSKFLELVATGLDGHGLPRLRHRLMLDGVAVGWESYEDVVGKLPASA